MLHSLPTAATKMAERITVARFVLGAARDIGISVWRCDRGFLNTHIPPDLPIEVQKQFGNQLNEYSKELREILNCQ
jgi:hypothetical protein